MCTWESSSVEHSFWEHSFCFSLSLSIPSSLRNMAHTIFLWCHACITTPQNLHIVYLVSYLFLCCMALSRLVFFSQQWLGSAPWCSSASADMVLSPTTAKSKAVPWIYIMQWQILLWLGLEDGKNYASPLCWQTHTALGIVNSMHADRRRIQYFKFFWPHLGKSSLLRADDE